MLGRRGTRAGNHHESDTNNESLRQSHTVTVWEGALDDPEVPPQAHERNGQCVPDSARHRGRNRLVLRLHLLVWNLPLVSNDPPSPTNGPGLRSFSRSRPSAKRFARPSPMTCPRLESARPPRANGSSQL